MNHERLRALFARHTAVHALLNEAPAVPLEAMLAVLEQRGSRRERRETLQRILADPESQREFELLRAAMRASARSAAIDDEPGKPPAGSTE